MIKPKKLQKGDKVALISLSCGMAGDEPIMHRTLLGKKRLKEEFGLEVIIMPNSLKGSTVLYENPRLRAQDFMDAFRNPEIKGVISMIGGDDTIRLLPYIDFEVLKQNPKIFMGYSDTTVNHFMLYKAGITSFYGPCLLGEFAENVAVHPYTKENIIAALFEKNDTMTIAPSPQWTSQWLEWGDIKNSQVRREMIDDKKGYELLQGSGTVQGYLAGGCIDVFPMMMGTDIWPAKEQWDNMLLFIETSEDTPRPADIKYLLRGLAAQGIFHRIKGLLVGKPFNETYYEEYKQVLLQVISKENNLPDLPILYNMNFGHTAPMCILPYGTIAEIDCTKKAFRLLESGVE